MKTDITIKLFHPIYISGGRGGISKRCAMLNPRSPLGQGIPLAT
jgi:hypothetical protein